MKDMLIQSQAHAYKVREISSLGTSLDEICAKQRVFLLVDSVIWKIHSQEILTRIPEERVCRLEASETMKSYGALETLFCQILDSGFRRSDHLVVIGGGVLQDIGCFVSSVLFRGISWTFFPSTLLAQCDSCVGSKSSLNISRFKNQLGTFYPPHEILLYFPFLDTLSDQEIGSGMGEAIKLHLIKGESEWKELRLKMGKELRPSRNVLKEIVWDCLQIKQPFVESDEFDKGIRNILNFGHTFAHAFESATHYAIPHGIAVTLGILGATHFSNKLGWVDKTYQQSLSGYLLPCTMGFGDHLRSTNLQSILEAMKLDKKNTSAGITFILTKGPGRMEKKVLPAADVIVWLEEFIMKTNSSPA